jgi:hypothetical protein
MIRLANSLINILPETKETRGCIILTFILFLYNFLFAMARAETNFLQTVLAHEESCTTQCWSSYSQSSVCRSDYLYFAVAKPTVSSQLSSSLLDLVTTSYFRKQWLQGLHIFKCILFWALKLNSLPHCWNEAAGLGVNISALYSGCTRFESRRGTRSVICLGHFR